MEMRTQAQESNGLGDDGNVIVQQRTRISRETLKATVSGSGAAKQDLETGTVGSAAAKRAERHEGNPASVNATLRWSGDEAGLEVTARRRAEKVTVETR